MREVAAILNDMAQESTDGPEPLLLSDEEKRALELYDKLQQLQLEIALITTQKNYAPGIASSFPILVVYFFSLFVYSLLLIKHDLKEYC